MTRINHSFKRQPSTSLSCIDGKKQNNTQLDCIHQNNPAKQEGGDPTKMDKTNHNGSFKILYLKQTLSHRVNLRETIYSFMRKLILVKHLHVHGNPGSRNPTVLHYSQGKKKKHTMIITNHQTLIEHPYSDATEIFWICGTSVIPSCDFVAAEKKHAPLPSDNTSPKPKMLVMLFRVQHLWYTNALMTVLYTCIT